MSIIKEYIKKDLITSEDDSHALPPGLCNSYKDERATVDKKRGWFSLRRGFSGLLDSLVRTYCTYSEIVTSWNLVCVCSGQLREKQCRKSTAVASGVAVNCLHDGACLSKQSHCSF